MVARNYLMLLSSGRSGSNWLLDIFNLSDATFPRNEPDEEEGAALSRISPAVGIVGSNDHLLDAHWDQAAAEAAVSVGPRDRIDPAVKTYFYPIADHLNMMKLLCKNRTRKILALAIPYLRGSEWRIPSWMVDEKKLGEALPIFKINNAPGLGVWALRHRPQTRLLHLIRHPGGMLNSWTKRYLSQADEQEVRAHNHRRLKRIVKIAPEWAGRVGDIDAMDLKEAELWYWRYANETLYVEGQKHQRYHAIAYERLTREPLVCARDAFDFAGLEWNQRIERSVIGMSRNSTQIAKAWHSRLTPEQIDMVNRVLDGSPLLHLWGERKASASAA